MKKKLASTFWRKSESVQAVRLTEHNIKDVAEDIGAEYQKIKNMFSVDREEVESIVLGKHRCFIGDWVVENDHGIRFYEDKKFLGGFSTHSEILDRDGKYARVFQIIMGVMQAQASATYNQDDAGEMDIVAIDATNKLLRIL